MSLQFVPRAIARSKGKGGLGPPRAAAAPSTSVLHTGIHSPPKPSVQLSSQPPARQEDLPSDDAALIAGLELSDYTLWTTPALRDPNRDGYIPLSILLSSSRALLECAQSEAAVIRSIRAHAAEEYDIRMILASNSKSTGGGYEIRRKDWQAITLSFPSFNRSYWQERSIYLENIPHGSRSPLGILRLLSRILPGSTRAVQVITFPPHHQDTPNTVPRCKGFALLTLSSLEDVAKVLTEYPWDRMIPGTGDMPADSEDPLLQEARKSGTRALSKLSWNKLQDEYIAYRDKLLANAAQATERHALPATTPSTAGKRRARSPEPIASEIESSSAVIDRTNVQPPDLSPASPFPPGCVVRVRGIDPSTNKTALRTELATPAVTIDYVDYTKGLDYCHFRLSSAANAQTLAEHVQKSEQALKVDVLQGRQEEVYWEQIPEKVRRQAVEKALAEASRQQHATADPIHGDNGSAEANSETAHDSSGVSRSKRKRRRRE